MLRPVIPAKAGIHLTKFIYWIPACAGMTIVLLVILLPTTFARYTPNDAYQETRAAFEKSLQKMDPAKAEKIKKADEILYEVNQKVCDRFEEDVNKLAAIMEELRNRQNITETRVAFGGVDTPIEQGDYWVNYAAEAIAYQRIQDYTPLNGSVASSMNSLRSELGILQGKVVRAKTQVKKALNYAK